MLERLRSVLGVDALCKQHGLPPELRLLVHSRESQPVMDELREWMTSQLAQKLVEPNSDIEKAYLYMLNRWDRRSSLFYRTQHGASVGDMFTSLIHTAELHGQTRLTT